MTVLELHKLPQKALALERTETITLDNTEYTLVPFRQLPTVGVGVGRDNFCIGRTALSTIKCFSS